ncbi:MAG: hypothetical protein ABJP89_19580 [Lentilitoribacter sp.]
MLITKSFNENNFLYNRVTYLFYSPKMGKFGQLAGAVAATLTLSGAAAAQEQVPNGLVLAAADGTTESVTDCVGFVREQRDLATETGISLSRADQKTLLHQCRNNELEAIIAQQNQILAALSGELAALNLSLDDQARILDDQGRELAHIVAINGQLVIRRQQLQLETAQLDADSEAKLAEAEAILQRLATS